MEAYINLDISHTSRPTSYAFLYNQNPPPSIKFLLHEKNSLFDMSKFSVLNLSVKMVGDDSTKTFSLNSSNTVVEDDVKYILWNIPMNLTTSLDTMKISSNVEIIESQPVAFDDFKIVFYQKSNTKLELTLRAINDFNKAYVKYLTSIKGYEYESPNGVPKLDENGIVKWKQIPYYRHKHEKMNDTLYDVDQIHGMRINRETKEWMFYDNDDEFWYFVNQVYGGGFTTPNKAESYDIYGGDFFLPLVDDFISANTFLELPIDTVDASTPSSLPTDFIVAELFGEAISAIQPKLCGGIFEDDY